MEEREHNPQHSPGAVPLDGMAPAEEIIHALGLDQVVVDGPEPMDGRTLATAWGLSAAGVVAFVALTLGAIAILNWLLPFVHYFYIAGLGSMGSADF